jgi:hypothetical protein
VMCRSRGRSQDRRDANQQRERNSHDGAPANLLTDSSW